MNAAQNAHEWGSNNLHRFALLDDTGRWVASAKRYRHPVRLDGIDGTMWGFGAVFTRPGERGRGHASAIVERLVERARGEGATVAGLFSEIGETFYARLGFQTVALDEVTVHVERKGGSAMLVRAGDERDLPALAAMHETRCAGARFTLRRDSPLIQYALSKKRLLAGLGPSGLRHTEFSLSPRKACPLLPTWSSRSAGGWTLEEAGRDPARPVPERSCRCCWRVSRRTARR